MKPGTTTSEFRLAALTTLLAWGALFGQWAGVLAIPTEATGALLALAGVTSVSYTAARSWLKREAPADPVSTTPAS